MATIILMSMYEDGIGYHESWLQTYLHLHNPSDPIKVDNKLYSPFIVHNVMVIQRWWRKASLGRDFGKLLLVDHLKVQKAKNDRQIHGLQSVAKETIDVVSKGISGMIDTGKE